MGDGGIFGWGNCMCPAPCSSAGPQGHGAGPCIAGACREEQEALDQRINLLSFARVKSKAAGQLRAGRKIRLEAWGTRVSVAVRCWGSFLPRVQGRLCHLSSCARGAKLARSKSRGP